MLTLWLRRIACLVFCLSGATASSRAAPAKAEHVVLVVWDGMRPDFVTEEHTPNLWRLAHEGVVFRRHHSIYPTLTSVNATALATGVYPGRSGMIANWTFRPEISGAKLARMDAPETIRKGDRTTRGHYLGVPTIAELVQAGGGRTAIVGTKTASLLHDREELAARNASSGSVTLFNGETIPPSALAEIVKVIGEFPRPDAMPNTAEDAWTTRALTKVLWAKGVPRFSLLWMSDPDRSQHATTPGSPISLEALKSVDANLGLLVRALEEKGVRAQTDILLASDHGFSTIARRIDLAQFLKEKGFKVADEDHAEASRGQVRVAGNGGSVLFYIGGNDRPTIARLVEVLQQTDFAAVIFSREKLAGTFSLNQVHLDIAKGPDVVMAFRWSDKTNEAGVPGMLDANAGTDGNLATHGSLSPFDLHNTFIAAGPDFRSGLTSELPTANIDVAATIMHLLGVKPPHPLDGRVVTEALTGAGEGAPAVKAETLDMHRELPAGTWRQHLRLSHVGASTYIDEGSGEFRAK